MDTNALKKFAQAARTLLIDQVTSKLTLVLDPASAARREHPDAMKKLDGAIANRGKDQVIEQVAYTWFNRFTALRFMDVNGYTNPRVVSPAEGATRPEILAEAMAGNLPEKASPAIAALLEGRVPSNDPQGEAYRLLLVHACNQWHGPMPFLFEKFDDYTELLMPDDLLSPTSILARLRDALTEDTCGDVEVIGWLYQFYISEKKDQVFAGLKKNIKITSENIPAATQLFTPHWIVRYLVENSLGRLWLLNRPASKLAAQMDYYIAPEEPETDFLRIGRPEDIRICDPAAGSGHMLTYAFDLLYAIYEEEGYEPTEIPALILTHNLHGVEIDDRAGALAAFALVMKAAARLGRRRFLRLDVQPKICVMQDVRFTPDEMRDVAAVVGGDLFTAELRSTLEQFEQAKNLGSLTMPKLRDPAEVARKVAAKDFGGDLLLRDVHERVLKALEMAESLTPKYHVVVANPPYAGAKGLNDDLANYVKRQFPNSKTDVYAAFIERGLQLVPARGFVSMVTMEGWMFLASYEKMRSEFLNSSTIRSMVHMPYLGRGGTSMGISFGTAAFISEKVSLSDCNGTYCCVRYFETDEHGVPFEFPVKNERFGVASTSDFQRIPGAPMVYWAPHALLEAFEMAPAASEYLDIRQGMATTDNNRFLRLWHEVSSSKIALNSTSVSEANNTGKNWFPFNKGGDFRRWFGNQEYIVNYENGGQVLIDLVTSKYPKISGPEFVIKNRKYYLRESISWSDITTAGSSYRYFPCGFIFDVCAPSAFSYSEASPKEHLPFLNSAVATEIAHMLNPSMHFTLGDLKKMPVKSVPQRPVCDELIEISHADWDAYETSWNFTRLPLLAHEHREETLAGTYAKLRAHWQGMTDEMRRLEEANNRIFIEAYGLENELTPEVRLDEITLTCNPSYRYGNKVGAPELDARLVGDTMAEFLHYAVGCMFGRYGLDAPGLILANQGDGLTQYLARVPNPSFDIDADNVIPVLDGEWFADDITGRFRRFLRVTFGEAKFRENLAFIEAALGKDVRKWFTKDFFDYHVRRYKKRPIYWMFSSPKGTFSALIYMHRYRPDTVSVVLNDYLRELISKLQAERARLEKLSDDPGAGQTQRTRALKEVAAVIKQIDELEEWEREVVFPLAQAKIEIDLDDGVKRNYPKFGAALKPIKGLETADE